MKRESKKTPKVTDGVTVSDQIDTTQLGLFKTELGNNFRFAKIADIKDTAKNLIDNIDDISASGAITIDDASVAANTNQINTLQLKTPTSLTFTKVRDSIKNLKDNKADLTKAAVTFTDTHSNAADFDTLVGAAKSVTGDVIDTPQESDESDKQKISMPPLTGDVAFESVVFSFDRNNSNVLNNFDYI